MSLSLFGLCVIASGNPSPELQVREREGEREREREESSYLHSLSSGK